MEKKTQKNKKNNQDNKIAMDQARILHLSGQIIERNRKAYMELAK